MANRKKTTKKSEQEPKTRTRRKRKEDSPQAAAVRDEIHEMQETRKHNKLLNDVIFGLIYIALGVFIFIAVTFQTAGAFGNAMGDALKGLFGLIGLILPWYLIFLGILMVLHKATHFSWKSLLAGVITILMFCLLNSVRYIDPEQLEFMAGTFYEKGITLDGGGLIGMMGGVLLVKFIGKAGLLIFAVLILLVCFLLLFNTPISAGLERGQERREEKRLMREREAEIQQAEEEAWLKQQEEARLAAIQNPTPDSRGLPWDVSDTKSSKSSKKGRKTKDSTAEIPSVGGDVLITSPFETTNVPPSPFAEPTPVSSPKKKKSNVLDFLKGSDPFGRKDAETPVDAAVPKEEPSPVSSPSLVEEPKPKKKSTAGLNLLEGIEQYDSYGSAGSSSEDVAPLDESNSVKDISEIEGVEALSSDDIDQFTGKKPSKDTIARDAVEIAAGIASAQNATQKAKPVYKKPSIDLLNVPPKVDNRDQSEALREKAMLLERTLQDFNVDAHVVQVTQGPAVTRYEIQPSAGVKVSKIVSLTDDIALNLRAKSIRIEAPIPGKAAVGIEIENERINMVSLREIVDSQEFKKAKSKITFAVGKDIAGKPIVADLKGMPHLLIAGSTGSGKSVCINSIITSLMYKANPDEVKMILIDPKVVELGNYNGIPHLLIPVVTDPSKAAAALSWAVVEMTNRYKLFAQENVRDLASYNQKIRNADEGGEVLPQVVIIIDELSDLMMAAPSQVEDSIVRLAQMARAAGMHLIVATQRPSVDVITGLIKANIPSRIAFAVSSQFDSRTILDRGGAEHLVGKGDMLFNPLGQGTPLRVQGTFVSDDEVQRVIEHAKAQVEDVDYDTEVIESINSGGPSTGSVDDNSDELLPDAIECVVNQGAASVSMLQRRFRIGYNRAARIVDEMEERGIVGPADGSRPREVLLTKEEWMMRQQGSDSQDEIEG